MLPTAGCLRPRLFSIYLKGRPKHSLVRPSDPALTSRVDEGAASPYRPGQLHAAAILLQLSACGIDVLRARLPTLSNQPCRVQGSGKGGPSGRLAAERAVNSTSRRPNDSRQSAWNCCLVAKHGTGDRADGDLVVRSRAIDEQLLDIEKAPEPAGDGADSGRSGQLDWLRDRWCLLAQPGPVRGRVPGASPFRAYVTEATSEFPGGRPLPYAINSPGADQWPRKTGGSTRFSGKER